MLSSSVEPSPFVATSNREYATTPLVRIFYSSRFARNVSWLATVVPALNGPNPLSYETVDIDKDATLWRQLGLRSVPTSVVFQNGEAKTHKTAYLSPDQLRDLVLEVQNTLPAVEAPGGVSGGSRHSSFPKKPLKYVVSASSGAHRYERWNEQSLSTGGGGSGWTAPSRKTPQAEFLECSFVNTVTITSIWFRPRQRADGIPSWKSFPRQIAIRALTSSGELRTVWEGERSLLDQRGDCLVATLSESLSTHVVRIEILTSHDISGKSFPGFEAIAFDGLGLESRVPGLTRIDTRLLEDYSAREMTKHGLLAETGLTSECIALCAQQETPRSFANKTKLLFVRKGELEICVGDSSPMVATAGDVLSIAAGTVWSLKGIGARSSVIITFNGKELNSVWEAR